MGSVLLTLAAALAIGPEVAFGEDLERLKERGRLRILAVIEEHRREFVSFKDGTPVGFDVEILEGFARLHGLKVEVVPVATWNELVPSLLSGKGDLIANGFSDTEGRRRHIAFSNEIFRSRTVVYTRAPRSVSTLEQLHITKLAAPKGTSMEEALVAAGVPLGNVDFGVEAKDLSAAVASGRVQAAVGALEVFLSDQRRLPQLEFGMFLGGPELLAYGVRKEDTNLLAALNEYVGNQRRTPTWNRLVVQYFGRRAIDMIRKAREE